MHRACVLQVILFSLIMKVEFYISLIGGIIGENINTKQNELLSAHRCVNHHHGSHKQLLLVPFTKNMSLDCIIKL